MRDPHFCVNGNYCRNAPNTASPSRKECSFCREQRLVRETVALKDAEIQRLVRIRDAADERAVRWGYHARDVRAQAEANPKIPPEGKQHLTEDDAVRAYREGAYHASHDQDARPEEKEQG